MSSAGSMGRRPRQRRRHEGIEPRHRRGCASRGGKACSCTPTYQAQVWSPRDRKPIRKTFASVGEAKAWRQESQVALCRGALRAPSPTTLQGAADEWLAAAEAGIVRTRSGDAYKPSAIRAYRQALVHRVLPTLGHKRLTAISQLMLQDLADRLTAHGLSASSVRNTILPLRAIYRRAHNRGEVALRGRSIAIALSVTPLPRMFWMLSTFHTSSRRVRAAAVRRGKLAPFRDVFQG